MNVVALIGNLATDVEVKDVGDGKRVANFVLAVDRRSRDGGADFFRVVAWDRQAELCGQYLSKGRGVAIDGYLRAHVWEDEGKRRREVDVVARAVQFLASQNETRGEVLPFEAAVA